METILKEDVDLFVKPSRFLVAGLSGSGKSYFTSNLIRRYRDKFDKIVVIGSDLENISDLNVERNDSFNPLNDEYDSENKSLLIVFDDVIFYPHLVKVAGEIFVRGRHKNISALFLTQNLYMSDKSFRILSLNASHVVLFTIRDINQIKYFGKSFLNEEKVSDFITLYKKIVLKRSHGYLLIDFTKSYDSRLKIRSSVLGENILEEVFEI